MHRTANFRVTALKGAKEPTIAVEKNGHIHVVFGAGDSLYACTVTPGEERAGAPVLIGSAGRLALGMRRGPRVVLQGKNLIVSAIYGAQGGGRDGDLLAWRSTNGGRNWQRPVTISDVSGAAREGLHAMAVGPGGLLACSWLDLREKGTTVYTAVSKDGGRTWSKNVCVYRSPAGTVCECCHTAVAFTSKGELLAMFRNVLAGNRDMYLCRSKDQGKTFGLAQKLGNGSWPLNACPMDGGMLAVALNGEIRSAWRREGTVYTCTPGQPETQIETGQQPWTVAGQSGFWTAWLVDRPGTLRLLEPDGNIRTIARGANDPVLAASGSTIALAWTGPDGIYITRLPVR